MKKLFTLLIVLLLWAGSSWAQSTANYVASNGTNGSLALDMNSNVIDMSTGTTSLLGSGIDDTQSALTNLNLASGSPFAFYLMGQAFTQFGITDNGIMCLGALPGTSLYVLPNSTTATIAPFGNEIGRAHV